MAADLVRACSLLTLLQEDMPDLASGNCTALVRNALLCNALQSDLFVSAVRARVPSVGDGVWWGIY